MRSRSIAASLFLIAALLVHAEPIRISLPVGGRMTMWMKYAVPFLRPCSRGGPEDVESFWAPTETQLDALEAKLITFLSSHESNESLPPGTSYHRQYLGFVKGGRLYIYGSFYPGQGRMTSDERNDPLRICDGGHSIWGVVYDLESGEFIDLRVNPAV